MEKKTIYLFQEKDGIIGFDENNVVVSDTNGKKNWTNEKIAVQWIKRQAEKNNQNIEIVKVNGNRLYACYGEEQISEKKKHEWRKANIMSLADARGKYNKLVCIHCGLIVRHYFTKERHFLEEFEICRGKKKK